MLIIFTGHGDIQWKFHAKAREYMVAVAVELEYGVKSN